MRILITGGNGDLANFVKSELEQEFEVSSPTRGELDVSCLKSVETYFQHKEFDVVINAAGTLYSSSVVESKDELWIRDINVNLIGTYLVTKHSLVKNINTRIINISSTAAYASYKDWTSYCASKAGVMKLSSGLVKDGFDVVVLCPGAINTKLRNGLNIFNPNVMDLKEGAKPILDAVKGAFKSGDIVFYRKNLLEMKEHDY